MFVLKSTYKELENQYTNLLKQKEELVQSSLQYKEKLEEVSKLNLQKQLHVYNPQNSFKLDNRTGWNSYGFNLEKLEQSYFIDILTRLSDLALICATTTDDELRHKIELKIKSFRNTGEIKDLL